MVGRSVYMLAQNAGRSRLRPRKAALELTDAAVSRIKELLGKRHKVWSVCVVNAAGLLVVMGGGPDRLSLSGTQPTAPPASAQEYLKLGVKTRGCNGMAYTLNYAGEWDYCVW